MAIDKQNEKTVRISLIDEDPIFLNVLHHTLSNIDVESYPLEIKTYSDGLAFVNDDWYQSKQPQIVLLNDFLPKKSGLELIQILRKEPDYKRFRIIMMTQGISEDDIVYAYRSGIDLHIVKPFNLRVFRAHMERMIERMQEND